MSGCIAALNIKGEHFPCQQMEQMVAGSEGHVGWAHSNHDAEAIWSDLPPLDLMALPDVALNRLAQVFYENSNGIVTRMTGKEDVVAGLRAVLARLAGDPDLAR